MKHLKLFENQNEDKIIEGNERIFTEVDILESFKNSLIDSSDSDNKIFYDIRVNYQRKIYKVDEFIEMINNSLNIEHPTFSYFFTFKVRNYDLEDIKEELEVLNDRFIELTNCKLITQTLEFKIKSNKSYKSSETQGVDGDYLITEKSETEVKINYINNHSDRYN